MSENQKGNWNVVTHEIIEDQTTLPTTKFNEIMSHLRDTMVMIKTLKQLCVEHYDELPEDIKNYINS
jgi:esterase/lipase superfamily enzyme